MKKRAVITGLGIVAPNGTGKNNYWNAIVRGESGVCGIDRFDASGYPTRIAAQVNDFLPTDYMDKKDTRWTSRFSQLAVASARMALEDSQLVLEKEDGYRTGVAVGTAIGGLEVAEKECNKHFRKGINNLNPFSAMSMNPNSAVGMLTLMFKIKGPNITISTGCSAGLSAVAYAFDLIAEDKADIMITGGAEAPIFPVTFDSFCSANVLSKRNNNPKKASRPFEKTRDGYVLGEGSGFVILEERQHALSRGAFIYAEIAGYGVTNDCYSLVKLEPTGREVSEAMRQCLKNSALSPEDIDYINAHGSSSLFADKRETSAIKDIFGVSSYDIPISSIKSMVGQSLAGTSGMQVVRGALILKNNSIPPTINYEEQDPDCDLDYVPNHARKHRVDTAMLNAFGMGGNNISMVIKRHKDTEEVYSNNSAYDYHYGGNYNHVPLYMMKK